MRTADRTSEQEKWRRLFLTVIATLVVIYEIVISLTRPRGDFLLHWEFGRRLLAGEYLYKNGNHVPYPPCWAVLNAPFSLLPVGVAKALFLLIGVSALAAIIKMLGALSAETIPLEKERRGMAVTGALILTAPFLIRDLDDGGQNLVILALALGGIYFWTRHRTVLAGAGLGAAIALKCTPALLLLYFAWKREWKMAAATLAFGLAFALTPIFWQGPAAYLRHMQAWGTLATRSLSNPDPSTGVLGQEVLQNRALRPALARYLMVLPEGHPGRFDDRGYLDFGHLSPSAAGVVIKSLMLLLLAAIAWLFRVPARPQQGELPPQSEARQPERSADVLWESAAVLLVMLLYSPITWGQHCVAVLPITYLLVRSVLAGRRMARWEVVALCVVAGLILGTDRLFLGRRYALLLESYHLVTLSLLALLIIVLNHIADAKGASGG